MENTLLKIGIFIITIFTIDYFMKNNILYISNSNINGKGLFTSKDFNKNDIIIKNLFKNKPINERLYEPISYSKFQEYINIDGKYINHCNKNYNIDVISKDNKIYKIIALKNIKEADELIANYNKIHKKFPFISPAEKNYYNC